MKQRNRQLIVIFAAMVGAALCAGMVYADSGMQIAPGANYPAYPDVTVGTSCAQVLTANPNNRMDAVLCNTGASVNARCAGSGASSSAGTPVDANDKCAVLPTSAAITCCAESGTTTIAPSEITR